MKNNLLVTFVIVLSLISNGTIKAMTTQKCDNHAFTECLRIQEDPLTPEQVRHYIKTNILEVQLQQKVKSQANRYDNVIKAFYAQRKNLLEREGWIVEVYEITEARIFGAINALETDANQKGDEAFKNELDEIKNNPYLTAEQKSQTIELLKLDRETITNAMVNAYKNDWPAVTPYRETLKHLTDYSAGNRQDPPELK